MELPISKESYRPAEDALVRAIYRADIILARTMSNEESLPGAAAFTRPDLPRIRAANFAADVHVPDGLSASQVISQIKEHFAAQSAQCMMMQSADGVWDSQLEQQLQDDGYRASHWQVMLLDQFVRPSHVNDAIQIIPVRAAYPEMFQIFRTVAADEMHIPAEQVDSAAAMLLDQLDEPRYEAILARLDGKPVGMAAVISLGQMGVVHGVFADPAARGRGVGGTLMSHLIDHCQRSLFDQVLVDRSRGCYAIPFYESLGFRTVAEHVRYHRKTS